MRERAGERLLNWLLTFSVVPPLEPFASVPPRQVSETFNKDAVLALLGYYGARACRLCERSQNSVLGVG